jgi:hypothetical protein
MAGALFVGVHSGGVQLDRTMYGPGSRAGAAPAAIWLRRVDGPSRGRPGAVSPPLVAPAARAVRALDHASVHSRVLRSVVRAGQ